MNKHGTDRPISKNQVANLFACIAQAILSFIQNLDFEQAKWLLSHKTQLINTIRDAIRSLRGNASEYSEMLAGWQDFYWEVFGIEADFSSLVIPEEQEGFDRLLIVAQGTTPQKLYDKCKEMFPSWKWTNRDLDEIITSDRTVKDGAYAIWVRDRVEADEELKNLSANQLKNQGVSGITLEERLIYELKYFKETGKHLDIANVTLCAGSRYVGGRVPSVDFRPHTGEVNVVWAAPGGRSGPLRSRQTVSA